MISPFRLGNYKRAQEVTNRERKNTSNRQFISIAQHLSRNKTFLKSPISHKNKIFTSSAFTWNHLVFDRKKSLFSAVNSFRTFSVSSDQSQQIKAKYLNINKFQIMKILAVLGFALYMAKWVRDNKYLNGEKAMIDILKSPRLRTQCLMFSIYFVNLQNYGFTKFLLEHGWFDYCLSQIQEDYLELDVKTDKKVKKGKTIISGSFEEKDKLAKIEVSFDNSAAIKTSNDEHPKIQACFYDLEKKTNEAIFSTMIEGKPSANIADASDNSEVTGKTSFSFFVNLPENVKFNFVEFNFDSEVAKSEFDVKFFKNNKIDDMKEIEADLFKSACFGFVNNVFSNEHLRNTYVLKNVDSMLSKLYSLILNEKPAVSVFGSMLVFSIVQDKNFNEKVFESGGLNILLRQSLAKNAIVAQHSFYPIASLIHNHPDLGQLDLSNREKEIVVRVLTQISSQLLQFGNFTHSLYALEDSLKIDKENVDTISLLATVYAKLDNKKKAEKYLKKLVEKVPHAGDFRYALALSLLSDKECSEKTKEKAVSHLLKGAESVFTSQPEQLVFLLVDTLNSLNRKDESIYYLEEFCKTEHGKNNYTALMSLAKHLLENRSNDDKVLTQVCDIYKKVIKIKKYEISAHYKLASCQSKLRKIDEAKETCIGALNLSPNSVKILGLLASIYKSEKNWEQAQQCYEKLSKLGHKFKDAEIYSWAIVKHKVGNKSYENEVKKLVDSVNRKYQHKEDEKLQMEGKALEKEREKDKLMLSQLLRIMNEKTELLDTVRRALDLVKEVEIKV